MTTRQLAHLRMVTGLTSVRSGYREVSTPTPSLREQQDGGSGTMSKQPEIEVEEALLEDELPSTRERLSP